MTENVRDDLIFADARYFDYFAFAKFWCQLNDDFDEFFD